MKKLVATLLLAFSSSLFTYCSAQYTDLLDFNGTGNGLTPYGDMTFSVTGDTLFGMAQYGGSNGNGTAFSILANGTGYNETMDFNNSNGSNPTGSFIVAGNILYATTTGGGANGDGVIFSVHTDGTGYVDMYDFDGPHGFDPLGSLAFSVTRDTLFGMANGGGANGDGDVFCIKTDGTGFADLFDFNGSNGSFPAGTVTVSGNKLYGMANSGGANGDGVIFSIQTDGTGYVDMFDFAGSNGEFPNGSLTLSGSTLYGLGFSGGVNNRGVIFSIQTNGSGYTDIYDLSSSTGKYPYGSLLLSGSTLYGTASEAGANGGGSIFSIQTNGSGYTDLYNFSSSTGDGPYGSLIISGTTLYGTASLGGANGDGVVFSLTLLPTASITVNNNASACANNGSATANVVSGTTPYTYAWAPTAQTTATATGLSAGGYTVTVTDNTAATVTASVTITQIAAMSATKDSTSASSGCNGAAGVTVSGGSSPYTYAWTLGGGSNDTITGKCVGTYTCIVTDALGCTLTKTVDIIASTGIATIANNAHVAIYPNPTSGMITVQSSLTGAYPDSYRESVEVYNVLGQQVYSMDNGKLSIVNCKLSIDLSSQPSGLYLLRVLDKTGNAISEQKIIKTN